VFSLGKRGSRYPEKENNSIYLLKEPDVIFTPNVQVSAILLQVRFISSFFLRFPDDLYNRIELESLILRGMKLHLQARQSE
jgi:hypothetical protein